jgi:lipopolysaccharide export system permease protein
MRIAVIDRYLLREIAAPSIAALALLFQLLVALQLLRRVDVLLGSGVTTNDLGFMLWNLTPHYLVIALPIAFLIGTLIGLGRLSEDREIEGLLSCAGLNPMRLAIAPAVLGALVSAFVFALIMGPEAAGLLAVRQQMDRMIKLEVQRNVHPGIFYDEVTGLTLFTEGIDAPTGRWRHVLVNDERDPRAPLLILAQDGVIDAEAGEGALKLRLGSGQAHRQEANARDYFALGFETCVLTIGVEDSILRKNSLRSPDDESTPAALVTQAREAKAAHGEWRRPATVLHRKLGMGLGVLAFVWLGVPLALGPAGAQAARARGYLYAIAAVLAYFVLQRLGSTWGIEGRLPPWLAGELPNLLFLVSGSIAWRFVVWRV